MTNGDKIRAMSNEELAELIFGIIHDRDLYLMEQLKAQNIDATLIEASDNIHIKYHKDWLNKEVQDE